MNQPLPPIAFYTTRITDLQQALERLYKRRSILGWLRFAALILTIVAIYQSWHLALGYIIIFALTGITSFLLLVSKDTDNKELIENLETLISLNKKELEFADGNYHAAYDGKDLEPEHHTYAADLDIFGKASLYQYVNRCNAAKAKALLAKRLLIPLSKESILQTQETIKELSANPIWRQQIQAFGKKQEITLATEKRVKEWLEKEEKYFVGDGWKILLYVYPIITITISFLYFADILSTPIFSLAILIFYITALTFSKNITGVYQLLSGIVPEITVLSKELNWFEKEIFNSTLLQAIQKQLKSSANRNPSAEINNLKSILNRFDVRLNVFAFILLNTFLLWDLRQMIDLKKWKEQNKNGVPSWFEAIAEVEFLTTIATLHFNHPDWCTPKIEDTHLILSGAEIGHPLICLQQRITNNFNMKGTAQVDLITGSNMAGKSTFLRSLGINMILAYTGAPVCAKNFSVSICGIMSSMRITDNLAENTSTFYAELKKLKSIIDAVNGKEKIFILLDEILRGTNSLDRHTGSAALIKQLIKENAVALIATHDVELANLEKEFPANISNYHFDVQVAGEELYFDYKLKEGICTSLNASLLMKKIGIEVV